MTTLEINQALSEGRVDEPGVLPKRDQLKQAPVVFRQDFGLTELPEEPGAILIRGARQYGKSTWSPANDRGDRTLLRWGDGLLPRRG